MVIRRFIYSKSKLGYVACSTVTGMAADAGGIKHLLCLVSDRFVFNTCDTLPPFHRSNPGQPKFKKLAELNRR
jgi:hypothetical protein